MQTPFDIAADLDTPVSAYLKLGPFQPRFLLESVEGGERIGRYSFVGFGNALEVRLESGSLRIGDETRPAPSTPAELAAALREALERAPQPGPALPGLPLAGGLVGATSYDIARRMEPAVGEGTLAPRAGEPELAYVAPESLLVFDHVTRRMALLHDGTESERRALRDRVIETLRGPVPPTGQGGHVSEPAPSVTKAQFCESVARVQAHIAAGDVYQLVLSIQYTGTHAIAPFDAYRALRLLNPSPYMYFCDLGDTQVVGSSPEALVRMNGRRALLRPIAGTRPRGADAAADIALEAELLADSKEGAEHVMLVDLARNDLGRVAVAGSVQVEPFRIIERYSHVMHLVSGVEGIVAPEHDALDLFNATFPAGTVVGAPKVRAMQLIDELEPVRRGLYAGTVGYFGRADGGITCDQAIAIRTIFFRGDTYTLQAGAGIVADSSPEAEYAEIHAKSAALARALETAREGL